MLLWIAEYVGCCFTSRYLNELFQAKEVALHLVVGGVTAQIVRATCSSIFLSKMSQIAGGSQRSHATTTEAQKQLDKNLRPCLAGMTGIVGLTANSRCPQTFSFPSPGSSRSSRRIHDKLSGVYDPLVDLSHPELVDNQLRRNSRKERYVLQSYPLFDKRTTTAVLQFVCADGKRTTFGNDEVFDPFNVGHTKVLKQICNYVVVLLREWYPVADRRALHDIWAKAAKNVDPADTVVSAAPTEDNKDTVHSEGSESEYSADHEDSEEEGEEDEDAVEVTVSGGGQLWGLTEEERQIDWRTAEPGWDVRSLATIYQSSFEAGLMAAQDVVNNLMNAS
ncbi:hypothetical protein FOZ62_029159 [Perkinsus olseni]|uniref:Uncharacterized protein n=1 Tax=Perkinsus olseni TaxID=32597 RepID=A0A7J6UDE8_PEROL|nr:hypothetical protein FOZ62_029159 [Perkinsus olseni]